MSKAEFATLISVSAGRVSQYLSAGQIHGRAIEGEGRFARIRPDVAIAQLGLTIDPSQGFGANGKASAASWNRQADFPRAGRRTGAAAELPLRPLPVEEDEEEDLAEQLARERLQQQKYKTAQMERQEKAEAGIYTRTEDVRREIGRTSSEAFKVMEQGLPDLAGALAEAFNLPQRDIQKTLTRKWRDIREQAAAAFRERRDEEPELIASHGDDDPPGDEEADTP
ncbi:hypothetical protein [Martelella soudanensis]|uniref:hypothetical protein n=1 Tax=unclassified Martelella TaxID=2629616 RepID=UPI0015DED4C5|nr:MULTISPECIES: hypothetical protein [unclassified Martelella]